MILFNKIRVTVGIIFFFIFVLSIIVYLGSFNNFFYQDDFFDMYLSRQQSLSHAFNLFRKPILNFYVYRPLTTQFFWSVGMKFFGLNPIGYHIISYIFFSFTVLVIYFILRRLFLSRKRAVLAVFAYTISATHFYRLFFLSQFQEIGFGFFFFLTILTFLHRSVLTILFLVLSLMCKETAIVLPIVILLVAWYRREISESKSLIITSFLIIFTYLVLRYFYFGFFSGGVYSYVFTLKPTLNNFFWYFLWSLGVPEPFNNIKFFSWPQVINIDYFTKFGSLGGPIIVLAILLAFSTLLIILYHLRRLELRYLTFYLAWFVITLLPVAFFPFHKFAYSLTVPIFGVILLLAYGYSPKLKRYFFIVFSIYIVLQMVSISYDFKNHWSSKLAFASKGVYEFFRASDKPVGPLYFRDTLAPVCPIYTFRSNEISNALFSQIGPRILFGDSTQVYYEFSDRYRHLDANVMVIDSGQFLR